MGGVFSFLGGLLSLGASAGLGIKEDRRQGGKNKEYESHNYAPKIQEKYDQEAWGALYNGAWNTEKIYENINSYFPSYGPGVLPDIAATAIAKKKMEEETEYEYLIKSRVRDKLYGVNPVIFLNGMQEINVSSYEYRYKTGQTTETEDIMHEFGNKISHDEAWEIGMRRYFERHGLDYDHYKSL